VIRTLTLFLLLSVPALAGWRWSPSDGWVEDAAVVAKDSPGTADELAAAGEFTAAARRYMALSEAAGSDIPVRKLALLRGGDAWLAAGSWAEAYDAYEEYSLLAAEHAERLRGKRFQIEACIVGVTEGAVWDWFGALRGSRWASKKGKELLSVFAYEDFSASARLRFAGALLAADHAEEAIIEFDWLLTDYPDSAWTPTARYRKGESHLSQFGGLNYDGEPLIDARREFQRYLDDYPRGDKVPEAKKRLSDLDELQAEKDWRTYKQYRHLHKWRAARLYLRDIIRKYPDTSWAAEAREALPGVEEECADLPLQDRERK